MGPRQGAKKEGEKRGFERYLKKKKTEISPSKQ
jgi:hypothetical protein